MIDQHRLFRGIQHPNQAGTILEILDDLFMQRSHSLVRNDLDH